MLQLEEMMFSKTESSWLKIDYLFTIRLTLVTLVTKRYAVRITLNFIQRKRLIQSNTDSSETDLICPPPKKMW